MSDTQIVLKQWLAAQLEIMGRGAKSKLAKKLGHSGGDKVTRMLPGAKEPRSISISELQGMASFFNSLPPGYESMKAWLPSEKTTTNCPESTSMINEEELISLLRRADPSVQEAVLTILKRQPPPSEEQ